MPYIPNLDRLGRRKDGNLAGRRDADVFVFECDAYCFAIFFGNDYDGVVVPASGYKVFKSRAMHGRSPSLGEDKTRLNLSYG